NWLPAAYTDEECRLVSTGGREIKIGAEVVISDWKLFVDIALSVYWYPLNSSQIRLYVRG
ncbi:unnamed protein product, partial [marine sediment metagenome]